MPPIDRIPAAHRARFDEVAAGLAQFGLAHLDTDPFSAHPAFRPFMTWRDKLLARHPQLRPSAPRLA